MRRLIFIILFLIGTFFGKANDTISSSYVDSKTYQYYLASNWKPLIKLGKLANKNGIDFYYLQLRMGTAYFYEKNYIVAAKYFEKSLLINPDYEFALEMLFYCYTYSGNLLKVYALSKKLDKSFLNRLKNNANANFNSISFSVGYLPTNNYEISGIDETTGVPDINQYKDMPYLSGGISLIPYKNISLNVSFSHLQLNSQKELTTDYESLNPKLNVLQDQIYLNSTFRLGKNTFITGAANLIKINTDIASVTYSETIIDVGELIRSYDTIINTVDVHVDVYDSLIDFPSYDPYIYKYQDKFTDYSLYFGLTQILGRIKVSLGAGYSKINYGKHYQGSLQTYYYPFGNLNLYGNTGFTYVKHEYDNDINPTNGIVINQTLGQKIASFLWLEEHYLWGNTKDYSIGEASLIQNSVFHLNEKIGFSLIFPLKNITLSLTYQYQKKEDNIVYIGRQETGSTTITGNVVVVSSWEEETTGSGMGQGSSIWQTATQTDVYPYTYEVSTYEQTVTFEKYKFNNQFILGGLTWKF